MIRSLTLILVLSGSWAFAQQGPSEEQKCQSECGQAMSTCMVPCMGTNPKDADKPENKSKAMACIRGCSDQQKPCLTKCKSKSKK